MRILVAQPVFLKRDWWIQSVDSYPLAFAGCLSARNDIQ